MENTGIEADWRDEWLRHIEPVESSGFLIHAPWHDVTDTPAELNRISIDPGRVFGSGHHPTTQLALTALHRNVSEASTVLDAGCGTGILSIAAAKLGASKVVGVDLDHDVLAVAQANVEANSVGAQVDLVDFRLDTLADDGNTFDVVIANIVIGDLRPLVLTLERLAASKLILSGFLDDQFETVIEAFDGTTERPHRQYRRSGWGCIVTGGMVCR